MAVLDWPTDRAFAPVQPGGFSLTPRSPKSAWAGFYTGNRQTQGHAADRMLVTLTLPGCDAASAARREAFIGGLVSSGDQVRLGHFLRPMPRGTLQGSPKIAQNAAAGARSVTLTDGVGLNLLRNPSFERSTLTPWTVTGGTVLAVRSADSSIVSPYSAKLENSSAGAGHYLGQLVPCRPSTQYTLAAFLRNNGITSGALDNRSISLSDLPLVAYAQDATLTTGHPLFTWTLKMVSITTGPAATQLDVRLYSPQGTVYWDAVQLVEGPVLSYFEEAPTLLAGDWLSVGQDLMPVGYTGSSRTATDDILVPLSRPLLRAVTAGQSVQWIRPTGRFELLGTEMSFEHGHNSWQSRVSLPFLEV